MIEINPIAATIFEKWNKKRLWKEKIAVACDLPYHTFDQIFPDRRNRVSPSTMRALLMAGIITELDKIEYDRWFQENKENFEAKRQERIERAKRIRRRKKRV